MKYENARDVLPEPLLKQLQKYAAGKLLYVPAGDEKKAWGEASGYREQLQKRNQMIRNMYAHGHTLSELADEYYLSLDSIKKIVYARKNDTHIAYSPTVASAVQYANNGMLEEWVQCYLLFTLKAVYPMYDFAEDSLYFGVIRFPLRLLRQEEIAAQKNYSGEQEEQTDAPLLVQYKAGRFYCTVQHDAAAALKRRRINACPAVILLDGNAEYKHFMRHYGSVFGYVDQV